MGRSSPRSSSSPKNILGAASGSAKVKLLENKDASSTTLSYEVSAQVKGKIAQLGSRLIQSTAKKLSKNFFGSFVQQLEDMNKAK